MEIKDKKGAENLVANHLSRLERENTHEEESLPINESFPNEQLYALLISSSPWYVDYVNYLANDIVPYDLTYQQKKKKFFFEVKNYFLDDPYLFKYCSDQLIRRCVNEDEIVSVLTHCHSLETGGHFGPSKTAAKVLQSGFYSPTVFKDAYAFVHSCDRCQRIGNVSRRNEMPLTNILEVELFDIWGIDFMGHFPSSFKNQYILVVVDYVSKRVEAIALPSNDSKSVIKFF